MGFNSVFKGLMLPYLSQRYCILWRAFNQFLLTLPSGSGIYMYHSDALEAMFRNPKLQHRVHRVTKKHYKLHVPFIVSRNKTVLSHGRPATADASCNTVIRDTIKGTSWTWILPAVYPIINPFTATSRLKDQSYWFSGQNSVTHLLTAQTSPAKTPPATCQRIQISRLT
jgi:glucan phosphoethanolaminetransferase (alkaline phosphatase superfamily)